MGMTCNTACLPQLLNNIGDGHHNQMASTSKKIGHAAIQLLSWWLYSPSNSTISQYFLLEWFAVYTSNAQFHFPHYVALLAWPLFYACNNVSHAIHICISCMPYARQLQSMHSTFFCFVTRLVTYHWQESNTDKLAFHTFCSRYSCMQGVISCSIDGVL